MYINTHMYIYKLQHAATQRASCVCVCVCICVCV